LIPLRAPRTFGFGSKLVLTTVERMGGSIDYDWLPEGLVAHPGAARSNLFYQPSFVEA
jgi:hypothetical protein